MAFFSEEEEEQEEGEEEEEEEEGEEDGLTERMAPPAGKVSVRGISSLGGSRPCLSTQRRAASTRLPLLPRAPSVLAMSTLLLRTRKGTGSPPGPPDPSGAEKVPASAISTAHLCRLALVLL